MTLKKIQFVSTFVVIAYFLFYVNWFFDCGSTLFSLSTSNEFLILYVPSWIVFGFWLMTVTFLHHHDHDTKVFDDSTWSFVMAAFETVCLCAINTSM